MTKVSIPITVYQELYEEDITVFELMAAIAGEDFETTNIDGKTYLKYKVNEESEQ